jgi:hypothetical protein
MRGIGSNWIGTAHSPGEVLLSCQGIGRRGNFHLSRAAMQRSLASAIVPRSTTPLLSGQPLQRLALHAPQHHAHCSSSCNSLLSAEPTRRRNSSQGAFMDVDVDVELGIAKDRTQTLQIVRRLVEAWRPLYIYKKNICVSLCSIHRVKCE